MEHRAFKSSKDLKFNFKKMNFFKYGIHTHTIPMGYITNITDIGNNS